MVNDGNYLFGGEGGVLQSVLAPALVRADVDFGEGAEPTETTVTFRGTLPALEAALAQAFERARAQAEAQAARDGKDEEGTK